jgi:hypothetical protein
MCVGAKSGDENIIGFDNLRMFKGECMRERLLSHLSLTLLQRTQNGGFHVGFQRVQPSGVFRTQLFIVANN